MKRTYSGCSAGAFYCETPFCIWFNNPWQDDWDIWLLRPSHRWIATSEGLNVDKHTALWTCSIPCQSINKLFLFIQPNKQQSWNKVETTLKNVTRGTISFKLWGERNNHLFHVGRKREKNVKYIYKGENKEVLFIQAKIYTWALLGCSVHHVLTSMHIVKCHVLHPLSCKTFSSRKSNPSLQASPSGGTRDILVLWFQADKLGS